MNKFFRKAIVLALAGSALLYVGCTKDYSGEITTLQKELEDLKKSTSEQFTSLNNQIGNMQQQLSSLETAKERIEKNIQTLTDRVGSLESFRTQAQQQISNLESFRSQAEQKFDQYDAKLAELDGEIAGLKANIDALQKVDQQLQEAIDAAKARIKALEDNTYNKTEVDNKLEVLKNWAAESFATKEVVSQIETALGQLKGTVQGIDSRLSTVETTLSEIGVTIQGIQNAISGINTEITGIKNQISDIKGDINALRNELAEVRTIAETAAANASQALGEIADLREQLKNYYTIAEVDALLKTMKESIDAEIDALQKADVKLNERIDSLAGVTKKIEDDFAAFVTATNDKLADLEAKLDNEIALRLADSAANVAAHKELKDLIDAIDAAYKAADDALNARCDALNERCALIEGRVGKLEGKVATLRDEMDKAKQDILDNATEIANVKTDIATKYAEVKARFEEDERAIAELAANVILLWLNVDILNSAAERIQSVVFVPEYDDFRANLTQIFMGNEPVKNIVSATFEVQPAEAIVYVDSLIKENELGNKGIGLAVKELKSRAVDADEVIYDVTVSILDDAEHPGRFVIEAFLDPEVFDEEIAISCVLGDYEVGNWYAGNGLQSTFVGTYAADEVDLFDTYVWFDETQELALDDSLGVEVRIPYTQPAEDSLVFNVLEDVIAFRMNIGGAYKTIEEVAEWLYLDESVLTPVGEVKSWITKDAEGHEVNGHMPFELEDFAPETSLTTTKKEGEDYVDPMFVHYTTARKEIFKVGDQEIAPFAFVGVEITKNQVPAFDNPELILPWSYMHPAVVDYKLFTPDQLDPKFATALTGTYDGTDEHFAKDGEAYTPGADEKVTYSENGIVFDGWSFEALDVRYLAATERFETESDDYEINVPFTLKQRPDDRKVYVNLQTLEGYGPSYDCTRFMDAIEPAFNGEEDYFIGDARDPYDCVDSLYNAYDQAMDFVVDSIKVNGEVFVPNQACPITVDIDYDPENHVDVSTIMIEAGFLPYGAEVTVYGRYTAFLVNFDYEISFNTPAVPFFLVLTPYDKFDPSKDKTIIVEGDDVTDPDKYTLEQMYYTKYLRVQDQEGVPYTAGERLEVRFEYSYEDLAEFGEATEAERGEVLGYDVVDVLDGVDDGYLDKNAILTWGTYTGRHVTVTATLYDNDIPVSEPLEFYIETAKPIKLLKAGVIGTTEDPLIRVPGNNLVVNVAQDMVIGGILSRDENFEPYYVEDPAIFGYNDNNINQETGALCDFYGLDIVYDWENVTATLNGVEWTLHEGVDYTAQGNELTLIADNGKGAIVLNVPVRIRYYLDYCGAKAEDAGVIVINIKQI